MWMSELIGCRERGRRRSVGGRTERSTVMLMGELAHSVRILDVHTYYLLSRKRDAAQDVRGLGATERRS